MDCPACTAPKAYRATPKTATQRVLASLGWLPMRCHHCYHKFHTLWLFTIGQRLDRPATAPRRRVAVDGR